MYYFRPLADITWVPKDSFFILKFSMRLYLIGYTELYFRSLPCTFHGLLNIYTAVNTTSIRCWYQQSLDVRLKWTTCFGRVDHLQVKIETRCS